MFITDILKKTSSTNFFFLNHVRSLMKNYFLERMKTAKLTSLSLQFDFHAYYYVNNHGRTCLIFQTVFHREEKKSISFLKKISKSLKRVF